MLFKHTSMCTSMLLYQSVLRKNYSKLQDKCMYESAEKYSDRWNRNLYNNIKAKEGEKFNK